MIHGNMIHDDFFGEENEDRVSFSYDNISYETRITFFYIITEYAYHFEDEPVSTQVHRVEELQLLNHQICKHYGKYAISDQQNALEIFKKWITKCSVKEFLQTIVIFNDIKLQDRSKDWHNRLCKVGDEVNGTFNRYKLGYMIVSGRLKRIALPGFETLVSQTVRTNEPEKIDLRIQSAVSKYFSYDSTIEDKRDAITKLVGVYEYLRDRIYESGGTCLYKSDDKELCNIMNNFNIRHNRPDQHGDYDKDIWYDWYFYTFLASIHVLLKLNKKEFNIQL